MNFKNKTMEYSPLKYLDYDVSQMLCEQVRLSQEYVAREYHINLYNKYKYSNPYKKDINELIKFKYVSTIWNEKYLEQGLNIEEMRWREKILLSEKLKEYKKTKNKGKL